MKQLVQSISGGPVRVVEVPAPVIGPTEVLVQTHTSTLSPGTERALTELAHSNLVSKARARPDLVRQVARKARTEGLARTARAVRSRLGEDVPLGYSASGVVLEVGETVAGIAPGDLVATAGAGKANHAELQAVPGLLCARVPKGVVPEDAAFATLGAIALNGLRLAELGPGARLVVIGLGLVGQLTMRLGAAAGYEVAGIDVDDYPVARARQAGGKALREAGEETTEALLRWSRGAGADAVVLTAAAKTSDAIMRTPELCRDRAIVVIVGDVGLDLARTPFYEKELTLRFARSYGPGRHDLSYEGWGVDYPIGHVRWTEGRNLAAVLDLFASGRLAVADLVTHRFPIEDAPAAYKIIENRSEPSLGVQLSYQGAEIDRRPVELKPRKRTASPGVGLIGAGAFAGSVLVPAIKEAGFDDLVSVASASGVSARHLAEKEGFSRAVSEAKDVIHDPDVDVVFVATPHDTHASLTVEALRAGKHVFCEKPLALTFDELDEVTAAWQESEGILFVGFNRRWSKPIAMVKHHFANAEGPLVITYRVSAGKVPKGHWYEDRRQGGRLLGEVCHFIDTCAAIVGESAVQVQAMGSGPRERLLAEEIVVSLRYGDGSLATIGYATGGLPTTEKERIDVLGRGHTGSVVDFRQVDLDDRSTAIRPQDKGHLGELNALRGAMSREEAPTDQLLESTRATLEAAAHFSPVGESAGFPKQEISSLSGPGAE